MGQGQQGRYTLKIAAIKILDPHAIEIVDGSDHVGVHKFNDEKNEWDKKAMDAALFVYRRNRMPYHFLHIDYFFDKGAVEQITDQKKVKVDAPLMFYKNEQNCTRCFRFQTTDECNRIAELVKQFVTFHSQDIKQHPVGILSMLALAQEMTDNAVSEDTGPKILEQPKRYLETIPEKTGRRGASINLMNFFASANPPEPRGVPSNKRMLPGPVHVDQIEKQQRYSCPTRLPNPLVSFKGLRPVLKHNTTNKPKRELTLPTSFSVSVAKGSAESLSYDVAKISLTEGYVARNVCEPLTQNQLLQAMSHLIKNDKDILTKLHEAYLQSFNEMVQK